MILSRQKYVLVKKKVDSADRGVDGFLKSGGAGSSVRSIICTPGLNRVS